MDEVKLRKLEERLLGSEIRRSADDVGELLADDFMEFGSSGRVFNKAQIIAALIREPDITRSLVDFRATRLAPEAYLVTYRVIRCVGHEAETVNSLRSSIWRLICGRWQMIFHQGTITNTSS